MDATYQPAGWCRCGYRVDPGVCPECGRDNPRPLKHDPLRRRRRWIKRGVALLVVAGVVGGIWHWRDELAVRYMPLDALLWVDAQLGLQVPGPFGTPVSWARSVIQRQADRMHRRLKPEVERRFRAGLHEGGITTFRATDFALGSRTLIVRNGEFLSVGAGGWRDAPWVWTGAPPLEQNIGCIRMDPDRVRLFPEIDPRYPGFECPRELIPVTWGPATYLLPDDPNCLSSFFRELNSLSPKLPTNAVFWNGVQPDRAERTTVPDSHRHWLLFTPANVAEEPSDSGELGERDGEP